MSDEKGMRFRAARIGAAFTAAFKEFRQGKDEETIFEEMEEASLEETARLAEALEEQKSKDDAHGVEAGAKAVYVDQEKSGGFPGALFALKRWAIRAVVVKGFSLLVTMLALVISLAIGISLLLICLRFFAPEAYCGTTDTFSDGDTYDRCIATIFDWEDLEKGQQGTNGKTSGETNDSAN